MIDCCTDGVRSLLSERMVLSVIGVSILTDFLASRFIEMWWMITDVVICTVAPAGRICTMLGCVKS